MIANTCVVMHNMVAEERRESYTGDGGSGLSRYFLGESEDANLEAVHVDTDDHKERLNMMAHVINNIKSVSEHIRLRRALMDQIRAHVSSTNQGM